MVHFSCCFVLCCETGTEVGVILRILQTGNRNKAILTIVIGLKNILCWNLVKSALDKEDKSVPVYSPVFNFLFVVLVCNVFV